MRANILIAARDEAARAGCAETLEGLGFRTAVADSARQALAVLASREIDVVVADARLAAAEGHAFSKAIKQNFPGVDVVLMADPAEAGTASRALKLGAYDGCVTKPFRGHEVKQLLERLVEKKELEAENRMLQEQLRTQQGFGSLIGASTKMQDVYQRIIKVAVKRHPVLILGESGTGKELVARAIHARSPWSEEPFVPVDCGALTPTLVESELFGHVRGAFTNATENRQGLLATAGSGTVFLDEIAELPIELQAKLLRALQEREVKPLGSNTRVKLEGRVIAATNQDPDAAVRRGTLRRDLYFRLNVVSLKLPPLRERKNDLPLLIHYFMDRHGGASSPFTGVSYDAMTRLMNYDWPGNVRELENCIQRALSLGSPPQIQVKDLPSPVLNFMGGGASAQDAMTLRELERRAILQALETSGGDRFRAAKLLGIGKTTIYRKLKEESNATSSQAWVDNMVPLSSEEETQGRLGSAARSGSVANPSTRSLRPKARDADPELLRNYNTALTAIDILYEAAAANSQEARKALADMADRLNDRAGHWERIKRTRDTPVEDVNAKTRR